MNSLDINIEFNVQEIYHLMTAEDVLKIMKISEQ
jgi:hypothetical protein